MNIDNRQPVYVQVVHHFKEQIATGILKPGQKVPSRRELAQQLKINPNTAQRAYKEMEEEGLMTTAPNQPSKITTDEQTLQSVRDDLILQAVDTFVSAIRAINVPVEDVLPLVQEKYEQKDDGTGGR